MSALNKSGPVKWFSYTRLYLPTGERSQGRGEFFSRQHLHEVLNDWNRCGAGVWQYWED